MADNLPHSANENTIIALLKPNLRQILRVCLNLKKLVDAKITGKKSAAEVGKLSKQKDIIQLALNACGGKGYGEPGSSSRKYQATVAFSLLVVITWYQKLMELDLNEYDTNSTRKTFTEHLCRHVIEHFVSKGDETYLFINVLCTKFSVSLNGYDLPPKNALEMAIDIHLIPIITANGFQKCIKYLWRGWLVQSSEDASIYEVDTNYSSLEFRHHFNPDRLKAPKYQNFLEIFFLVLYLVLFTLIINCEEKNDYLHVECLFYVMTFCFLGDEIINVYHVGMDYLKFWNYFNDTMYLGILFAFITRVILPSRFFSDSNEATAFKVLSCVAPFMWTRLLFYLDCFEFIGVIIVVISKMMKESILFFVMLSIIVIGFLQGFLGLDTSDGEVDMLPKILHAMVKSTIAGAQFPVFDNLTPPYSVYVYYVFRFLINVMLMKILSALYNNSYKETVGQLSNEYLALFSSKVLRYIRAPDEHVYIPPLNCIEWALLVTTTPLGISTLVSNILNYYILQATYAPALFLITIYELREARRINYNRLKGLSDDSNEIDLPWDLSDGFRELNEDTSDLNDQEYNETVIRQGLKDQRNAEREDPEFLSNLNEFNKVLNNEEPLKKTKNVEEDVAKLANQIETLVRALSKVSEENEQLAQENKEIKAKLGL